MEPSFLTVKEAARLIGKSPSAIRRMIYPIIQKDDHPDRIYILPTVQDAIELREKVENFPWRVSEELLRRKLQSEPERASPHHTGPKPTGHMDSELLALLRRELDSKNTQ